MTRAGWLALLIAAGSLGLALLTGFATALTAVPMPLIAVRVWGGVALTLAIYLGIPSQRRLVANLDLGWITAAHAWRVAPGAYFLWQFKQGALSPGFAMTGGVAEVCVGLSAPLAGLWLGAATRRRAALLAAWHVAGLAALLHLMGTGFLLHLAGDRLIEMMAQFPLFLLPLYAIPLTLAGHCIALFALYAQRGKDCTRCP